MTKLLSSKGLLIFEEPYLGSMFSKISYDQIYDEHIFMFTINSIKKIFNMFDFGIIGFSDFGEISNFKVFGEQEHQYGFQIESSFELKEIDYEWAVGYIHGFTDASANHSVIWNFEVEF